MAMTKMPVPGTPRIAFLRPADLACLWRRAGAGVIQRFSPVHSARKGALPPLLATAYWLYGKNGETWLLIPRGAQTLMVAVHGTH
jgi:hypothetical protein